MSWEIPKSFSSAIYERMTSPFYGTLILSWLVWNWKIWVLLIFVSEENVPGKVTKVDYIGTNFSDWSILFWGPIISALVFVALAPLLANLAYLLGRWYLKWRYDLTNRIENNLRLTQKDSMSLRQKLEVQRSEYAGVVERLEDELETTRIQLGDAEKHLDELRNSNQSTVQEKGKLEREVSDINVKYKSLKKELESTESARRDAMVELEEANKLINKLISNLPLSKKNSIELVFNSKYLSIRNQIEDYLNNTSFNSEFILNALNILVEAGRDKRNEAEVIHDIDSSLFDELLNNEFIDNNNYRKIITLTLKGNFLHAYLQATQKD